VPGLGETNAREADSVARGGCDESSGDDGGDVRAAPALISAGRCVAAAVRRAILAAAGHVFVANANDDSVSVLDPGTNRVEAEIPIRIPGLDGLRALIPIAWPITKRQAGCWWRRQASTRLGVIDVRQRRVIGHLPAAWVPHAGGARWRYRCSSPTRAAMAWGRTRREFRGRPAAGTLVPGDHFGIPSAGSRATAKRIPMRCSR